MNFRGHTRISLAIAALGAYGIYSSGISGGKLDLAVFAGSVLAGGGFPDLDVHSYPRKAYISLCLCLTAYVFWAGVTQRWPLLLPWLLLPLAAIDGHRGWTHSYLIPVSCASFGWVEFNFNLPLVSEIWGYSPFSLGLGLMAFGAGITGHLLADSITPFSRRAWFPRGF